MAVSCDTSACCAGTGRTEVEARRESLSLQPGSSGSPRAPCSDSWHNASPEVRRCVDEAERGVQRRSAMPRYPTAPSARQAQRTPRPGARGAGGADAVTGQGREAGDQLDERRGEGGVSVAGAARNWATAAPASRGRRRFSRHVSPEPIVQGYYLGCDTVGQARDGLAGDTNPSAGPTRGGQETIGGLDSTSRCRRG